MLPARRILSFAAILALVAAGFAGALVGCKRKSASNGMSTLRGKVVSANGRALPEVSLRVLTPEKTAAVVREGKSGADGSFAIPDIPAGRYLLRGELPGFSPAGVPVQLSGGETLATVLRLDPVQLLEGIVQDAQGRPLGQAALFAWPLGGGSGGAGVLEAKSGADGKFALAGLAPGPWTVMVEAPGFGTLRLERVDVPARPLVLRLEGEARSLGGMVVDATGAPVVQARVLLGGPALSTPREAFTNDKGLYLFHGLGFGRFVLRATAGTRVSQHEAVQIDEDTGWLPPAKLTLASGATLNGRVVDDRGRPLARAEVELISPAAGDAFEIVRSDGEGKFTVTPVAPGRYQAWARLPGHAMATAPEVELRSDIAGRLEIKLSRAAQILGQIVDDSGRPLSGAMVTVSSQSGLGIQDLAVLPGSLPLASEAANLPAEALARKGRLRSVASDGGGRVVLADLPPGQFRVEISAPTRISVLKGPLTLDAGHTADLGKVTLAAGVALNGSVLDENGTPLPGARIEARQTDSQTPAVTTVAGEGGKFTVFLPRGVATLMANAPRRAPEVRDGLVLDPQAPPPPLEIRLLKADAVVEGSVRDPQGRPAHRARILAFPLRAGAGTPDGGAPVDTSQSQPLAVTSTDRDGRFRLQNVPRQPFLVEARHAAWPARAAVATPGQAVYLELPRPGAIEGEVRDRSSGAYVSSYRLEALGPDGRAAVDIRTIGAGFELKGLLPGRWRLRVHAQGFAPVERLVDVPPGASRTEASVRGLRIELTRSSEVAAAPSPLRTGGAAP